jgi:hypothetical protein
MTTKTPKTNREAWLQAGVALLASEVFGPLNYTVPAVNVSCSWPGGGSARKRIGECWPTRLSAAKINEVFISPVIADGVAALDILAHELVHAVDDCKSGHKAAFVKIARAIGLDGKPTATFAGPALKAKLAAMVEKLGAYPHAALNLSGRKKQTTRNIKVVCTVCEFTYRTSQKWLDEYPEQHCPGCGGDVALGA